MSDKQDQELEATFVDWFGQEELDAIERPVAQAQVESDEVTLEHIRARFASPATQEDIRNATQAFEDGFEGWGR